MFAPPVPKPKAAAPHPSARQPKMASQATLDQQTGSPLPAGFMSARERPRLAAGARLEVGAYDDPLERQADRVARSLTAAAPPRIGGDHAGGGASEDLRLGPAAVPSAGTEAPDIVHDVLRSPGQPLDPATRAYFEPRLGRDLSDVRVHVDDLAQRSADHLDALAYTVRRHIAFGGGRFAPATPEGRHLLAHELAHVVQQAQTGPVVQRAPRPGKAKSRSDKAAEAPAPTYPEFVPASQVIELRRSSGDDWQLTMTGHITAESVAQSLWPGRVPPGVIITVDIIVVEPSYVGSFMLSGVRFDSLATMEPSIAKIFLERGLVDETRESVAVQNARAAFRAKHRAQAKMGIDGGVDPSAFFAIDLALKRATKRNPELLIAFYKYYADMGNDLTDEDLWIEDIDFDKDTGNTKYGDTIINPSVIEQTSKFDTSNQTSLLGGTLIHEFVHTPQGGGDNQVGVYLKEAKAYGIEIFFSQRMGDKKREAWIGDRWPKTNLGSHNKPVKDIYYNAYHYISALYRIIDNTSGEESAQARRMATEFISKNEGSYGPELKSFMAANKPKHIY